MFKPADEGLTVPRWPYLFSAFLDSRQITHGCTSVFSVDMTVSATDYAVDGRLFGK